KTSTCDTFSILGVFAQLVLALVFKTSGGFEQSSQWVRFPYTPAYRPLRNEGNFFRRKIGAWKPQRHPHMPGKNGDVCVLGNSSNKVGRSTTLPLLWVLPRDLSASGFMRLRKAGQMRCGLIPRRVIPQN